MVKNLRRETFMQQTCKSSFQVNPKNPSHGVGCLKFMTVNSCLLDTPVISSNLECYCLRTMVPAFKEFLCQFGYIYICKFVHGINCDQYYELCIVQNCRSFEF